MLRAEEGAAKAAQAANWRSSELYEVRERVALAYAEAVVTTSADVGDAQFDELRAVFTEDEVVELTAWIALENLYSSFNRALRIEAQGFCHLDLATDEPPAG
jgi:alkylhydroperoxidase family enzyme